MQDITLNTKTNDLLIANGDFVISESSQQEANLIIQTFQGNWFEHPLCGVGIINYLASSEKPLVIEQAIKKQLETDGFIVQKIDINGTTMNDIKINLEAVKK